MVSHSLLGDTQLPLVSSRGPGIPFIDALSFIHLLETTVWKGSCTYISVYKAQGCVLLQSETWWRQPSPLRPLSRRLLSMPHPCGVDIPDWGENLFPSLYGDRSCFDSYLESASKAHSVLARRQIAEDVARSIALSNLSSLTKGKLGTELLDSSAVANTMKDQYLSFLRSQTSSALRPTKIYVGESIRLRNDEAVVYDDPSCEVVFEEDVSLGNSSRIKISGNAKFERSVWLWNSGKIIVAGSSNFTSGLSLKDQAQVQITGSAHFHYGVSMMGGNLEVSHDATFWREVMVLRGKIAVESTKTGVVFKKDVTMCHGSVTVSIPWHAQVVFLGSIDATEGTQIKIDGKVHFFKKVEVSKDSSLSVEGEAILRSGKALCSLLSVWETTVEMPRMIILPEKDFPRQPVRQNGIAFTPTEYQTFTGDHHSALLRELTSTCAYYFSDYVWCGDCICYSGDILRACVCFGVFARV
jgi:formylmethanofuran dehydrogenase subunit C